MLPLGPSLKVSALASPGNDASPRWLADFSCQYCIMEQRTGPGSSQVGVGRNETVNHLLRASNVGWVEPCRMAH